MKPVLAAATLVDLTAATASSTQSPDRADDTASPSSALRSGARPEPHPRADR